MIACDNGKHAENRVLSCVRCLVIDVSCVASESARPGAQVPSQEMGFTLCGRPGDSSMMQPVQREQPDIGKEVCSVDARLHHGTRQGMITFVMDMIDAEIWQH